MPVLNVCDCCRKDTTASTRWINAPWRNQRGDIIQSSHLVCNSCWAKFQREEAVEAAAHHDNWLRIVNRFGFGARFTRS